MTGQTLNVPAGSPITIDVAFSDDSGVRAATAFIDTNGDGLLNGSDSTFSALGVLALLGLALQRNDAAHARDDGPGPRGLHHVRRGQRLAPRRRFGPGRRVNGLWSTRYAVQVTIV